MNGIVVPEPSIRDYFVDEAGDPYLFDRRRRITLGNNGCSRYFITGFLGIGDIPGLTCDLNALRQDILKNPRLSCARSLQPKYRQTALFFHAKDDMPVIRKEVFSILMRHNVWLFANVKDKQTVLDYAMNRKSREPEYRYNPNELYDFAVSRLFTTRLHKHDIYNIIFARRGGPSRTAALKQALIHSQQYYAGQCPVRCDAVLNVSAGDPYHHAGLQAVDYFLWALQRLYERQEEEHIVRIWPKVCIVRDMDDRRRNRYGEYYTKRRPLRLAALKA